MGGLSDDVVEDVGDGMFPRRREKLQRQKRRGMTGLRSKALCPAWSCWSSRVRESVGDNGIVFKSKVGPGRKESDVQHQRAQSVDDGVIV